MKKILLSLSLVFLCICFVGCSNTQAELANKLDAHLDRLNSTITSVKDINNSDITFQAKSTNTGSTRLKNPVVRDNHDDQIALLNLERRDQQIHEVVLETNDCLFSCKSQICEMIDMLKTLSRKIKSGEMKLDNNQISGVNELLSNLSVNTNRISMSKNETNTEVGKVKAMLNNTKEMTTSLNSRFIRLNNCLETRLTYYRNCLNCLNQIRILLTCENGKCEYENGEVCIDGKCYDNSELNKYGDNKSTKEQSTLSQSDQELFEEFKNYLERTRKENEAKKQELKDDEKRFENDYKMSENIDDDKTAQDDAATKQVKVDSNTENNSNEQNNFSDSENRIDSSFSKDIKDDSFYANKKKQELNKGSHKFESNNEVENQKTDTKIIETPNQNKNNSSPKTSNNATQNQDKTKNRHTNIDTFKDPTIKRNIDTYDRSKTSAPTQVLFEIFKDVRPFPDKITETNIVIFARQNPDKQFVDNTNITDFEQISQDNSNKKTQAKTKQVCA